MTLESVPMVREMDDAILIKAIADYLYQRVKDADWAMRCDGSYDRGYESDAEDIIAMVRGEPVKVREDGLTTFMRVLKSCAEDPEHLDI